MEFAVWLKPQVEKCFFDNLVQHTLIIVTANPRASQPAQLVVRHKDIVLFEETMDSEIRTAFTAASSGEYMMCLTNKASVDTLVPLHIQKGPEAKDYSEIAKKEHLDPAVTSLRMVEDELQSYHRNLLFMRSREGRMGRLHDSTASRIVFFCCINLIVMFGATVIHVWHLRNFFRNKKII